MKRLYYLLIALLPLTAFAGDIKFTRPALTVKSDTLTLEFSMNVADVKVNSEQSYAFTPVLRSGENYRAFPPVVVTGENGKYKMRSKERRMAKRFGYEQPYTVIYGRQPNRDDVVTYTMQVPYEDWMNHASMTLLQEGRECCETDLLGITVIEPDLGVKELPLPVAGEFCETCMAMVSFLEPEEEAHKVRSEQSTLYITYPVGGTEFKADYGKNAEELDKLKKILNPLTTGDFVTFKNINVCGYASPDGSAKANERVATKRADSFALYLKGSYNFNPEVLKVTSAGEDWDELVRLLKEEKPAYAEKALDIIAKNPSLDVREARLKTGLGAATYRQMMNTYYPRLRRLGVSVDFEVREATNSEAARLIYTDPKMLNLQEMYRVAKMYQPGTKEYKDAYQIAADTHPNDVVANVNAASAFIVSGDFQGAQKYMDRVKDDPRAYNNNGVLAWISGDNAAAKEWFGKALSVEPEKAQQNLEKMPADTGK